MLKILQWTALLTLVIFFFSLAGIAYYYSLPRSNYHSEQRITVEQKIKEQAEKRHSIGRFMQFLFPDAVSIFSFWLVLATIVLAIVAVIQISFLSRSEAIATDTVKAAKDAAMAAKDAVKLSSRIAEQQLRAYITPVGGAVSEFGTDGKPFKIYLTFKNSGQTPGHDLIIQGGINFAGYPLTAPLTIPIFNIVCGILGPTSEYIVDAEAKPLNAFQIQGVKDGSAAVYIFGSYSYIDTFAKKRTGEFRFFYGGNNKAGTLSFHPQGNKAD